MTKKNDRLFVATNRTEPPLVVRRISISTESGQYFVYHPRSARSEDEPEQEKGATEMGNLTQAATLADLPVAALIAARR